jgi:hypothetical protein
VTAGVADQVLRLADGRALGFRIYGDAEGTPVLFLHGTPGSRLKLVIGHDTGKELGLALVAPDRWGYGLSDVPSTPSLPAFAADMAALMDHLGIAGSPSAASPAAGPTPPQWRRVSRRGSARSRSSVRSGRLPMPAVPRRCRPCTAFPSRYCRASRP